MTFELLETVVLVRDLPAHGLKSGDVGAVVERYDGEVEVEFVTANGRTQALLSLPIGDVRHVEPEDLLAVRRLETVGR